MRLPKLKNKNSYIFFGPIADSGGPALRNKLTVEYLKNEKGLVLKIVNTHSKCIFTRIFYFVKFFFYRGDFIISVGSKGRAFFAYTYAIKRFFDKKSRYIIFSIGGTIVEEFDKNKKINNFIKNSLCVFSQTESMHKDFLKRNIKSFYFPNFKKIDNEPMNLTDRFAKPYKLVFLSSLRTKKGVELLIETVKKIPSNLVLLDLYGPIRKDFNKNILNVLPNNIAYKGFVRKENVTRVLAKYDLFIFPTFYEKEGFPSVILDAFAAGLPVVASNINFNSEIVKHLRNGFIFDYMSKNALYSTIIQALENVEKLKQISLNNIEDVKQYELKKVLNLVFHDLETICRR